VQEKKPAYLKWLQTKTKDHILYRPMTVKSTVWIATGYGLDNQVVGIRVPLGSRIFTSPCGPDRLWGPSNLLYNG
jgi:hypothetical protein